MSSSQEALKYYFREVKSYWIYIPSDGEQIFEDIWDAVNYAEELSDVTFKDFKKAKTQTTPSKG